MDPVLSISMIVLAFCFVLAAIGPAPRRAPPAERLAYPVLIVAGGVTYVAAVLMALVGMWLVGAVSSMVATTLILVCLWLARSPTARELRPIGEDRDEGGGGGGPKVPGPPAPRRPSPGGPAMDWGTFDDARAHWERPAGDRELVGA